MTGASPHYTGASSRLRSGQRLVLELRPAIADGLTIRQRVPLPPRTVLQPIDFEGTEHYSVTKSFLEDRHRTREILLED